MSFTSGRQQEDLESDSGNISSIQAKPWILYTPVILVRVDDINQGEGVRIHQKRCSGNTFCHRVFYNQHVKEVAVQMQISLLTCVKILQYCKLQLR